MNWLKLHRSTAVERFMCQDIYRWRNQKFAVSVYQPGGPGWQREGEGGQAAFIVEAVNVDAPHERRYIPCSSNVFEGLRGRKLLDYVDRCFQITELQVGAGAPTSFRLVASAKDSESFSNKNKESDDQSGFSGKMGDIGFSLAPAQFQAAMRKRNRRRNGAGGQDSDGDIEAPEMDLRKQDALTRHAPG